MKTINFYKTNEEYGCFSNFSRHPVKYKNIVWPTSEHAFQAQKFAGTPYETEILNAKTPREAATLGRDKSKPLRNDWELVKDDIMREIVFCKFYEHKDLQNILLSTEDAEIVEHTINDSYWGDGGDGSGKNMLGKILMETRDLLKVETKS